MSISLFLYFLIDGYLGLFPKFRFVFQYFK